MAKVKFTFDVAAIKKWLLEHGEKLAFGFTLLIFLMFSWSAISREVLDPLKQPPQLVKQSDEVRLHVKSSPWDKAKAGIQIAKYDAKRDPIAPAAYALPVPFNPLLVDQKTKRDSPELFPVEELKVASGFGAFGLKADAIAGGRAGQSGGASRLKGHAWVAITGLVPVQKQTSEYARVFDRALGGDRAKDVPKYAGFKMERAEIHDQDPNKLEWKSLAPAPIVKEFETGPPEVVHPNFVDPALTMPLRPLVPPNWGDAVTHPKIPLLAPGNVPPPPATADAPKEDAPKEAEDGFIAAHVQTSNPAATPANPADNPAKPGDAEIGYRLFRAFDFTVEPNKKYRYRVIVRLDNPNFEKSRQYLKDPATATQEYVDTKPTEPSGVISVPDGYQVLAGAVKPPKLGEPSAKLMLIAIDKETGMEATYELDVLRGTVGNTIKDVKVRDLRNRLKIEEMSDVDFKTDMLVLDIRGGKSMSGKNGSKLNAPGEVLLLDRNGDLIVRSELDDQSMYETRKPPSEEVDKRAAVDPLVAPKAPVKPPVRKPKPR